MFSNARKQYIQYSSSALVVVMSMSGRMQPRQTSHQMAAIYFPCYFPCTTTNALLNQSAKEYACQFFDCTSCHSPLTLYTFQSHVSRICRILWKGSKATTCSPSPLSVPRDSARCTSFTESFVLRDKNQDLHVPLSGTADNNHQSRGPCRIKPARVCSTV